MAVTAPGLLEDAEYVGSWVSVEIDKAKEAKILTDVSRLNIEVEVVEKTDTLVDTITRKRPGTTKYSEITLKRTLGPDKTFWNWAKSIRDGKPDYRSAGAIILHDISGKEIGRWTFENAWPSKWSASDLDVGTDDLMTEEITLQVELLKRES